jgi:protein-arginine kinase activator protein McsA
MASRKFIHDLVISLLILTPRRLSHEEILALEDAYELAFQGVADKEIKAAGQLYLQDGDFFPPKPKEILARVKDRSTQKHIRELVELYTCKQCHQKVTAITDGICLDCAGFPLLESNRVKLPEPEERDYKIEGRIKCQECGKIAMCIKEPISTGNWKCRECYSGLTKKEIVDRFAELKLFSGDRDHIFKWIQDAPF